MTTAKRIIMMTSAQMQEFFLQLSPDEYDSPEIVLAGIAIAKKTPSDKFDIIKPYLGDNFASALYKTFENSMKNQMKRNLTNLLLNTLVIPSHQLFVRYLTPDLYTLFEQLNEKIKSQQLTDYCIDAAYQNGFLENLALINKFVEIEQTLEILHYILQIENIEWFKLRFNYIKPYLTADDIIAMKKDIPTEKIIKVFMEINSIY